MELYKKDSKGKIRIYKTYTVGDILYQETGLLNGNLVVNKKKCIGKNIGRSNETTPEDQAVLEMNSRYKKKLDEGYFKTVSEAETQEVILPMLAKDYNSRKIDWNNCYVQPKLDGCRALGTTDGLLSRKGKVFEHVGHLHKELELLTREGIIDGELYIEDSSFQEITSYIKKYREGLTEKVKYYIYDMVLDTPILDRLDMLNNIVDRLTFQGIKLEHIKVVDSYKVTNEEELKTKHEEFLKLGYEGTIVRWGNQGYELNKRSDYLLKYKDFQDIALQIIDVVSSEQRPEQGKIVIRHNNEDIAITGRIPHAERERLLTHKDEYIGKTAEIRYFGLTDGGQLRFPVFVGLRIDK